MSQHCAHRVSSKVLKCDCCKACLATPQPPTHLHVIESSSYPDLGKESRSIRRVNESRDQSEPTVIESQEERFLRKVLEQEQTDTSEILECLDAIQAKLVSHVEKAIHDVKAEVTANSCAQNNRIQTLLGERTSQEFGETVVELRAAAGPTHRIEIDEERFVRKLNKLFVVTLNDAIKSLRTQETVPRTESEQVMVDFLDSRTMRKMTLGEGEVKCEYKNIRGHFTLFPQSRYCFVDHEHIVATGGLEGQYSVHNSYLISTISLQSGILPHLIHPRNRHATCVFRTPHSQFVYVFGGSNSPSVEKLELSAEIFASMKGGVTFDIGDPTSPVWEKQRELPYVLETASCVQHSDFIYVTGSDRSSPLKVVKYDPAKIDPRSPPDIAFDFLKAVVRSPCALCAWHTQMVVLYTDGRHHIAHRWTVGNPFTGSNAGKEVDVAGKQMEWTPVCPPVTKDSNCFILTETALVRYNFIRREVTFPKLITE